VLILKIMCHSSERYGQHLKMVEGLGLKVTDNTLMPIEDLI
jgi:hypothetical protein